MSENSTKGATKIQAYIMFPLITQFENNSSRVFVNKNVIYYTDYEHQFTGKELIVNIYNPDTLSMARLVYHSSKNKFRKN